MAIKVGETVDVAASYVDSDGTVTPATDVTFSVAGGTIATVAAGTNGHAAVHGLAEGHTLLTVTGPRATGSFPVVVAAVAVPEVSLTSIEVTPSSRAIALGTTQQMTATGVYSDATTKDLTADVTWSSSDVAIATIAETGIATSVAEGDTTITATLGEISGTTVLSISDIELLTIDVTPADATLSAGRTLQYTATGTFTNRTTQDLTTQVVWSSSDATATISNAAGSAGLATGVTAGPTTITATLGPVAGSASLTVTNAVLTAIAVTPADATVGVGTKQQLTATGTFSDGSHQDLTTEVTWTSSELAVATISDTAPTQGEATALAAGTTTITATLDDLTATTTLTVKIVTLVSLAVAPVDPSTALGHLVQFTATGTFSDGSTKDLTTQVLWGSTNDTVAEISNAAGSHGEATTRAIGTTTITAVLGAAAGTTLLTVTAVTLDSIAVNPPTAGVVVGATQQLTALAVFSDAHTVDVSATATWSSSDEAIATVDGNGLVTGVAVGTADITATSDGITGTATLTVATNLTTTQPRNTVFVIRATTPIVTRDPALRSSSTFLSGDDASTMVRFGR